MPNKKMSEARKKKWLDPAYRKKQTEAIRKAAKLRRKNNTSSTKVAKSKSPAESLTRRKGETATQFQSRRMKAMWADPKGRKKLLQNRDPSSNMKKQWQNPASRMKLLAGRQGINTKNMDPKLTIIIMEFCNNLHKTIEKAVLQEVKGMLKGK